MGDISAFDIVASLVLLAGMALGFSRGFVRQLADMGALYVGLAVAAQYAPLAAPRVAVRFSGLPPYSVAALVFFVLVIVVTGLLSLLLQSVLRSPGRRDMNEVSQVAGFALGAISAIAFISVALPVTRYAVAASWGTAEGTRQAIILALKTSDLRPFFESLTPTILALLLPLLPSGLPDLLRGGRLVDLASFIARA